MDGITGCYRGLTPKLLGNIASVLGSEKIAEQLGLGVPPEKEDVNDDELTDIERRKRFEKALSRDMILHISGTIISHPFQVITVRMMAQFIGHETKYCSILGSIATIYQEEGIGGFFNGLFPRLLGDIACLLFASAVTFIINKHLVQDKETRSYVGAIATFVTSTIMYPFQVVSNCMTLHGSRLAASKPPHMPTFNNWQECWAHLKQRGELKRGSSLLWRFYRPPSYDVGALPPAPSPEFRKPGYRH
ncbi:mitochondrial carrier homolog 2-like [Ctenocephalides felis]|nr:mitochondrial carrier homolog 2-like [Ctenocephalides felis]